MRHKSKKHITLFRARRSVTLVELLIAASILAMLLLSASTIFVNMIRTQKRAAIENYLATEGRFLMERIVREVRKGAVDYEQYYAKIINTDPNYGGHFGLYERQFFDTRSDGPGFTCGTPCENPDAGTDDLNQFQNPADGANVEKYTAFTKNADDTTDKHEQTELYLIDSLGKVRSLFKRGTDGSRGYIKFLKLIGEDENQDGISENWSCDPDWLTLNGKQKTDCYWRTIKDDKLGPTSDTATRSDTINDTSATDTDFYNITPANIDVAALNFAIYPLEDPYKNNYEPKELRSQPRITIVMKLKPDASALTGVFAPGADISVTVQTTVSSQVYNNISSYNRYFQHIP